ncbi:NO-inducible flavohemoprotein [Brevibacillus ginsengisoli]|uniref:NO-inducible flavohemoprotein n=1 Tax=Brevibacillus ginsengisoli TaxID=363854 RepID=UPI003CF040CE
MTNAQTTQSTNAYQDVLQTVKKLDPKKLAVIKATLPVVAEHGEAITKQFYRRMFESHPELKNIFNMTHQITGHQPKALADAVYGAAANIEDMSKIMPVLERIAEKHRSLQVKPEHYPIVGQNLLQAIKEVLGDAATDEIIDAWADAYAVIADVFIRLEDLKYQTAETQPGGWAGYKPFIVDRKVKESEVITSFYLKPADGKIASFTPGQFITIKMESEPYTQLRQYSLSDRPGLDYYRISVKREDALEEGYPAGVVSNMLHKHVKEGDTVQITAPAGDFYLDLKSTSPVVLLCGGVGLTPLMSMLNTLVAEQPERNVTYISAALNGKVHAFNDHIQKVTADHSQVKSYVVYQSPTDEDKAARNYDKEGYITLDWLKEIVSDKNADFYFCGPTPFMKAIYKALKQWGVSPDRIHYEFFGSFGDIESE